MSRLLATLLVAVPAVALGAERFAVIAVGDPPNGPDGDLTELTYQFRAACRDRVPNVLDPSDMRGRLLGRTSNASESELDRAYGGALMVYQNGEFDSSLRTLRAIVEDLESLPETEEAYFQWKRANLRLALSAIAANDPREAEIAIGKAVRVEPGLQPDPDQFSPGFRKRFEEIRSKVRALPKRRLVISSEGRQGTVYVNGRNMGQTPITLTLPSGIYRVGGGAGMLRVPSFRVDLEQEDQTVVLDFALAEALRMNGGPGLALAPAARGNGIIRAGAWLGVDKLIVVSRADEGQAQFLVGSIYDVLRGALLREGSVRMVAGGVPSVNLSALAGFLVNGQASREVKDLSRDAPKRVAAGTAPVETSQQSPAVVSSVEPQKTAPPAPAPAPAQAAVVRGASSAAPSPSAPVSTPRTAPSAPAGATLRAPEVPLLTGPVTNPAAPIAASTTTAEKPNLDVKPVLKTSDTVKLSEPVSPPSSSGRPAWKKPVAIGTGLLAVALTGLALQQNGAANHAYSQAGEQIGPSGAFKDAAARDRYGSLTSRGDRARTNAGIAAGAAAACAVTAAWVGWSAWHDTREPTVGLKVEF